MTIRFRSRGTTATATVTCSGAATHIVRLTTDGPAIAEAHDADGDAVMAALGAHPHPCQVAVNSLTAARAIHAALAGTADPPAARYAERRGWSDGTDCPACTLHTTLAHLIDPEHQAHAHAGDPHTIAVMGRWLARNDPLPHRDLAEPWLLLTPNFLTASRRLLGPDRDHARVLRRGGIRVEWLTTLAATLTPHGRTTLRARADSPATLRALTAARNVPPATVAGYLDAGITSHFHTYGRVAATPEQILTVYRATGGHTTLADLLAEGLSIPDAIARTARTA